ncbi:hypothetical protein I3760_13G032500 [Carya illinoinensis]|uniref:Uncharacterized protein n=1 Tax=Carya illinoinensis TaxID=32201 RepID=A0A922AJQ4_CARIL|nr:hypothetical protein I3760_13G032500 [Carya illinoinensis]KAG6680271.1 hypothetical protein I3842_13G033300 [Carya illinoinensis]
MSTMIRPGITFVLGAMCGIAVARGAQRWRHREARRKGSCPRQAPVDKTSTAIPGADEKTVETIPNN